MSKELGLALGVNLTTVYCRLVRSSDKQVYSVSGAAFEAFNAAHWSNYKIAASQESTDGIYYADMPAGIAAGTYDALWYQQTGGSPAITDPLLGALTDPPLNWSGSAEIVPADNSVLSTVLARLTGTLVTVVNPLGPAGEITIVRDTDNFASEGLQIDLPAPASVDISTATSLTLSIDNGALSLTGSYQSIGGKQYARFQPTQAQSNQLQAGVLHQYTAMAVLLNAHKVALGYGLVQVISNQGG